MTDKSDFVFVFDNAAALDCVFQEIPVGFLEREESDVVCYLLGDGQDSAVGCFGRGQV